MELERTRRGGSELLGHFRRLSFETALLLSRLRTGDVEIVFDVGFVLSRDFGAVDYGVPIAVAFPGSSLVPGLRVTERVDIRLVGLFQLPLETQADSLSRTATLMW